MKKLFDRFFRWYCNPDYYPDIQGDLNELYQRNLEKSKSFADRKYAFQVLGLFRPSIIRAFNEVTITNSAMLKNYLLTGTRHLSRQKLYTIINIMGLAIGLTAFLLISEYVSFERSYDTHYENATDVYRLSTAEIINGMLALKMR